ncbi:MULTISPECIES: sodium:proton antiporter [unclassified Actinobaculum]|uniref:cation:proton antiporter n=1 Tax=unclassified Actinobaculum TaxID=2609299 RepID=UPI0013DD9BA6|nr:MULTISPECIES: sodium:proton antiporter [unclassified Actinobaculum]
MTSLVTILAIFALTILAVAVGERTHLPYPVLLLISTAALAFLPFTPSLVVDPDIILPLFLPPLLFSTARRASWSVFAVRRRTLFIMAFALTAVTAFAVAGLVKLLVPALSLPLAMALGAMVAPPDPVAVESVAGPAHLPRRVMRALQTESLFNDAVAIILFTAAVAAIRGERAFGLGVAGNFIVGAVLAVAVGLLVGWIASYATTHLRSSAASGALTLVVPFLAYLLAEEVHASGVIAVVVTALEIGRHAPEAVHDRVITASFWEVADLLIIGAAFGLIGVELRNIVTDQGWSDIVGYLPVALLVALAVIVIRFFGTWVLHWMTRRSRGVPRNWRECVVVTWCGMRGLATLALALSLPAVAQGTVVIGRNFAVVTALVVMIITLVPTGLLLPWLIRVLKLQEDPRKQRLEAIRLSRRAERAALRALNSYLATLDLPEDTKDKLRAWGSQLHRRITLLQSLPGGPQTTAEFHSSSPEKYQEQHDMMVSAQTVALEAARAEVLAARMDPELDVATVDRVLRTLDLRTLAIRS